MLFNRPKTKEKDKAYKVKVKLKLNMSFHESFSERQARKILGNRIANGEGKLKVKEVKKI